MTNDAMPSAAVSNDRAGWAQFDGVRWLDGKGWPEGRSRASAPVDGPLSVDEFRAQLQREVRRSERSDAPLSIVVYPVDTRDFIGQRHANRLLDVLRVNKREIDVLGHLDDESIAVLCPETEAAGRASFIRKIQAAADFSLSSPVSATHPHPLFGRLTQTSSAHSAGRPMALHDIPPDGGAGYALKRSLDVVGSLAVLCLVGPLMAAVAVTVALTSRGPVIFRQVRLGQGGRPFTFYKFRSMVIDGGDDLHRAFVAQLIAGTLGDGQPSTAPRAKVAKFKLQSDPRVTPVGRFLRKTSLDELPQFFNVLKGEMSLVGPRPPLQYEVELYRPWHLRRILASKPGITGVWQVAGRSAVTFNDMVRMDLRYIRDCSLLLDLKLLCKTVLVVLRCDGAA